MTLSLEGRITAVIGAPVQLQAKYEALASILAEAHVMPGEEIDVTVPQEPTIGVFLTVRLCGPRVIELSNELPRGLVEGEGRGGSWAHRIPVR